MPYRVIECIKEDPQFPELTRGETYYVADIIGDNYVIVNENEDGHLYPKSLFKVIKGGWRLVFEAALDSLKNIFSR